MPSCKAGSEYLPSVLWSKAAFACLGLVLYAKAARACLGLVLWAKALSTCLPLVPYPKAHCKAASGCLTPGTLRVRHDLWTDE